MRLSTYDSKQPMFSGASWSDAIRHNQEQLIKKARKMSLNQIGDDLDAASRELAAEFDFSPPQLDRDNISADRREIEVTKDDYGRSHTFMQAVAEVSVPYRGEKAVFSLRPSTYRYSAPRVVLSDADITFQVVIGDRNQEKLRADILNVVDEIQWFLDQQAKDALGQTEGLRATANRELSARSEALRKGEDVVSGLGFKSKKV